MTSESSHAPFLMCVSTCAAHRGTHGVAGAMIKADGAGGGQGKGWGDTWQPFPAKAYAIENKRLVPSGFRKHKVNRINNICILCH